MKKFSYTPKSTVLRYCISAYTLVYVNIIFIQLHVTIENAIKFTIKNHVWNNTPLISQHSIWSKPNISNLYSQKFNIQIILLILNFYKNISHYQWIRTTNMISSTFAIFWNLACRSDPPNKEISINLFSRSRNRRFFRP